MIVRSAQRMTCDANRVDIDDLELFWELNQGVTASGNRKKEFVDNV